LLADVVQARPRGGDGKLGPKLGDDECIEQPTQQVTLAEHEVRV
jgi:hypothetical protein